LKTGKDNLKKEPPEGKMYLEAIITSKRDASARTDT
jgi:hypothetical protein